MILIDAKNAFEYPFRITYIFSISFELKSQIKLTRKIKFISSQEQHWYTILLFCKETPTVWENEAEKITHIHIYGHLRCHLLSPSYKELTMQINQFIGAIISTNSILSSNICIYPYQMIVTCSKMLSKLKS